jgi:predicted nucleotidyltransferase
MVTEVESIARKVLTAYHIKRAALFGSAARGEMSERSDVDMLVEFTPEASGLEFFGLHTDLEEAFGRGVDLVTYEALFRQAKREFRENALRDARVIYER